MGTTARFWRAFRLLFHQMMGMLFLCLSALGCLVAYDQWHKPSFSWLSWVGIGFAAMMLLFSYGSFRDAHRIR